MIVCKYIYTKRSFILGFVLAGPLFFTSCFSRFVITDKKIEDYYREKSYKPLFRELQHRGKTIHFAEFENPEKPLLLLIHGAPGAWYTWRNVIDLDTIRNNFHVIAIDRPGYGKSNYGEFEPDIHLQIDLIQQVINLYPDNPLYLAGRSYGAPIAVALASQNTHQTKRLLMFSPVLSPFHEKKYWFSSMGKWKLVRWMLPKALNVATDEKYAHLNQMRSLLPLYPLVKSETFIISGEKDWVAHSQNFLVADSLLSEAPKQKVLLKNAGHFLTFQYPISMGKAIYRPFDQNLSELIEQEVLQEEIQQKTKKQKSAN
jgi:pimeloyl-ACP methyl ester carboxylesterase